MKLWKSKKSSSCVPGKSSSTKHDDKVDSSISATSDRAMSPAQSEDSGLAADRGTTYATISLPRENAQAMGILFLDRADLTYPPVIATLNALGPAADFLAPGDRIHQIDGISTIGLTNEHVMNILYHGNGPAVVEIEYSLPEYLSQNSLCVTTKLTQITVERENGCLGLTLRGGGDFPLIVTNIRPHGPVYKCGRIKPGDRLLRVDNVSLINKTLSEAQQILKCGHLSGLTNLTIEYDVSVMQSVEFSMGPLLIEIERSANDKLGIVLSNSCPTGNGKVDDIVQAGVFIANILPASLADRTGALSIGDKIQSVDDTLVENTSLAPEDVMQLLDANTNRGFTQIQILPAHAIARLRGMQHQNGNTAKYGFNTLESRKMRQKKFMRKSSLPLLETSGSGSLMCRSEIVQVVLDCSQGSGICLGAPSPCGRGFTIAQVIPDSVADRSGCIQKGDRLLAVNKLYGLDITTVRQILGDFTYKNMHQKIAPNWVEVEIEFNMSDSVIPSSGVFNVKLLKHQEHSELGITVNATNSGAFIITDVKQGSAAHRTGSLRAGDILLAVDSQPLQHYNVDALLKDNKNDFTTLTIKRTCLPDFLFDAQYRNNFIYSSTETRIADNHSPSSYSYGGTAKRNEAGRCEQRINAGNQADFYQMDENLIGNGLMTIRRPPPFSNSLTNIELTPLGNSTLKTDNNPSDIAEDSFAEMEGYPEYFQTYYNLEMPLPLNTYSSPSHQVVSTVRLETKGGPLGITLAGSENLQKPIVISAFVDGGVAHTSGKLCIGDEILAINGENILGVPLSTATKLLQRFENVVELKIARNRMDGGENAASLPQPQAIYSKVHRRPRSPSVTDALSTSSSAEGRFKTIHVTLYKDKVYDDYGFSLSDGLYERGVYINRIRSGGPADAVGLLKSFDRIMMVNGTKTQDFDCCLTVPLIAASGDKIDMIVQRSISD
ncbi:glutamate receptor-interacting protein 2 [Phlebotomus argentipes]|uniref:glutamate receptor-interacting protein 2 n=1 Tax=Phlebotomus argentipes TaxID=94469 RepID=UPI002893359A|nr:glutamate receptor-interacting protein 2 [Phlebotomus argentipes]